MEQKEIWENRTGQWKLEEVLKWYAEPKDFQLCMAKAISDVSKPGDKVIEIGCELGVTSYLLPENLDKTLLDFNSNVLEWCRQGFEHGGRKAHFIEADMYNMPFEEGTFDVVFNAGVIEHYTLDERIVLLREYARVLKPGGTMIIAFPNHYSFPYRWAYLAFNLLGKWPYPKEFKLYDLRKSIEGAGLKFGKRTSTSRASFYEWLSGNRLLEGLFRTFSRIIAFEGYLTIIEIRK